MARIAGIELQDNWKVGYALTRLKGIGWARASQIVSELKLADDKRIKDLSNDELASLAAKAEEYPIEGDLIRLVRGNVQRLVQTGTYRGLRHNRGLPSRGQRTKTNARTKRGKRKTVGAFKKDMLTKMATNTAAK